MTTTNYPAIIWQATVPSGTYRLIDLGPSIPLRYVFEKQMPPDTMGGQGWELINFGYADALISAFKAIAKLP